MTLGLMDQNNNTEKENLWEFIRAGVIQILNKTNEGLSYDRYMSIYRFSANILFIFITLLNTSNAYDFCNKPLSDYSQNSGFVVGSHRGAHLLGGQLYLKFWNELKIYNRKVLEILKDYNDKLLLKKYETYWNRYTLAGKILQQVFSYINRHWVKREHDEGRAVKSIFALMISEWHNIVYQSIYQSLIKISIQEISNWRDGDIIDYKPIKTLSDSCVLISNYYSNFNEFELQIYLNNIEKPVIDETENYYSQKSKLYLVDNQILNYMHKVNSILEAEKSQMALIVHSSSQKKVISVIEAKLISDHKSFFNEGFILLLENYQVKDLLLIYSLLSRIENGLVDIQKSFELHTKQYGMNSLEKVSTMKDGTIDPINFVETVVEVYNKYFYLTKESFCNDPGFITALDRACREFINRNKIFEKKSFKSSELLASYADAILKKGSKIAIDSDFEAKFLQIINVLRYIDDKDAFQDFYRRGLARRLVNDQSTSHDAEQSMISKLKEICGYDYTNKLIRMFNDMDINKDLNVDFRNLSTQQTDIDYYFKILNTAAWPLSSTQIDFQLPKNLSTLVNNYTDFYCQKHKGRKLNWLWQYSKMDVKITLPMNNTGPNHTYTFTVSTFQYAILALFNSEDNKVHYLDINKITGLLPYLVNNALLVFTKCKLIELVGGNMTHDAQDGGGPSFSPESIFMLNRNFKSKRLKINLNVPLRAEKKQEVIEANRAIHEDHHIVIQAAIVRIMKTHKTFSHILLVNEAISQLSKRFKPSIPEIKKAIDALIDKDYIERSEDNNEIYNYLA
ncbi:hypothetical protein BB561_002499 [Smittium simulii]|uniref:Cullin-5 n=1 Tax=Smittium simulii TaxID=133385 RepID=A0A2T9YQD8_9FUNG|nr:hypothetical protein BB561_002499 [Smittium simulii]